MYEKCPLRYYNYDVFAGFRAPLRELRVRREAPTSKIASFAPPTVRRSLRPPHSAREDLTPMPVDHSKMTAKMNATVSRNSLGENTFRRVMSLNSVDTENSVPASPTTA